MLGGRFWLREQIGCEWRADPVATAHGVSVPVEPVGVDPLAATRPSLAAQVAARAVPAGQVLVPAPAVWPGSRTWRREGRPGLTRTGVGVEVIGERPVALVPGRHSRLSRSRLDRSWPNWPWSGWRRSASGQRRPGSALLRPGSARSGPTLPGSALHKPRSGSGRPGCSLAVAWPRIRRPRIVDRPGVIGGRRRRGGALWPGPAGQRASGQAAGGIRSGPGAT